MSDQSGRSANDQCYEKHHNFRLLFPSPPYYKFPIIQITSGLIHVHDCISLGGDPPPPPFPFRQNWVTARPGRGGGGGGGGHKTRLLVPLIKESRPVGHVDLPGTGNFCQIALLCSGVFKFDKRMGAADRGCRGDGQSSFISTKSIMISSVRKGGGGGGWG